jgi:hypothetical protein
MAIAMEGQDGIEQWSVPHFEGVLDIGKTAVLVWQALH